MKIIDKRKSESIKSFVDLKIGETFCLPKSQQIFMKTTTVENIYDDGYYMDVTVIGNAVRLETGSLAKFSVFDKVVPLNCECVIIE